MSSLTHSKAWHALMEHHQWMQNFCIKTAFETNPYRAEEFSLEAAGLFHDFSKELINKDTLPLLLNLAEERELGMYIEKLHNGDHVNTTEDRPALHYLLRARPGDQLPGKLESLLDDVQYEKKRLKSVSENILNGQLRGYTGKPFTDVVHIGIGGSDLGPQMIYQAMAPYQKTGIRCHFVANICAHDIDEALDGLIADTTLFIVASKSFSTLETLKNSDTARQWLLDQLSDEEAIARHFFAVTSKPEKAGEYGIKADNIFPFWDWVGGRYSVWSTIGLSLCIGLGYEVFERLLNGAHDMDEHFFQAPPKQNMPIILGLLGIWYTNFWRRQSHMIAPYDHRLRRLPAYLQQLEMESNGKSATHHGENLDYATCPAIWGEVGANSQHSFFQRLHQGPEFVPIDFIIALHPDHEHQDHHDWLVANCLAQSQALMLGQKLEDDDLAQHKFMPGNRPSSTFILDRLTPEALGSLLALYEHKVFVQSVIWDINAFDQWGVELGKKIGKQIKLAIDEPEKAAEFDTSTQQLLHRYQNRKKASD